MSIYFGATRKLLTLSAKAATANSRDDTLRIGVIGDSTTTSPGGFGLDFHHRLFEKLASMFGNIPASHSIAANSTNGAPFGLSAGLNLATAPWAASYQPPNISFAGHKFGTGEGSYQATPILHRLYSRNNIYSGLFFNQAIQQPYQLEVAAIQRANSAGGFRFLFMPTANGTNLFASVTATEDIPADLDADNGGAVRIVPVFSSPRTVSSDQEPQWGVQSSEATTASSGSVEPPVSAYLRIHGSSPVGAYVDCLSAGGFTALGWFGDIDNGTSGTKQNAADTVAQMRHNVIVMHLGLNDFYTGRTAQQVRDNIWNSNGANNKGIIGELNQSYDALGIPRPVYVIVAPPFRARDATTWTESHRTQHELYKDELPQFVQTLQNNGIDAVGVNTWEFCRRRGWSVEFEDFFGTTDRGAYSTSGVAYVAGDRYTDAAGRLYRCMFDHTSSTNTELPNDGYIGHRRIKRFMADQVHWTEEGAELVVQALMGLFDLSAAQKRGIDYVERVVGSPFSRWEEDFRQ